jgi:hypothetical protein
MSDFEQLKQAYEKSFFSFPNTILFLCIALACFFLALIYVTFWDNWDNFANLCLFGTVCMSFTLIGWFKLMMFGVQKRRYEAEQKK